MSIPTRGEGKGKKRRPQAKVISSTSNRMSRARGNPIRKKKR